MAGSTQLKKDPRPRTLTAFAKSLPKGRAMTRRQAQQALATASTLFAAELSATTQKPAVRVYPARKSRPTGRGAAATARNAPPEFRDVIAFRPTTNRIELMEGAHLLAVGPTPVVQPDSGLVAKIGSKISQLFAVGESIAAASQATQLQVTVGFPWTATVALTWDLPHNP